MTAHEETNPGSPAPAPAQAGATPLLEVRDLWAGMDGKTILKGVNLVVRSGEVHAIMGRNGSGKSTLAHVLMGYPGYEVIRGEILLDGRDLRSLDVTERARAGLFLGFQYPVAIPGVPVTAFLRAALRAVRSQDVPPREFRKTLAAAMREAGIPEEFASRPVNDGFSGGEKKRLEVLQMLMLKPRMAILDEADSGLDIDALKAVAEGVNRGIAAGIGVMLITHYQRILDHVKPDVVHVFLDGRVVLSGGPEVARQLEQRGYEWLETPGDTASPASPATR